MSKKKKNTKFKDQWGSLTDIGKLFGLSAIKFGAELKKAGFRTADGKPSELSFTKNMVKLTPMAQGFEHYMWNKNLLCQSMRDYGLKQIAGHSDKTFQMVQDVIKMLRESEKMSDDGNDKIAFFIYDDARCKIKEAVKAASFNQKNDIAKTIVSRLREAKISSEVIQFLMEDCGAVWSGAEVLQPTL